MSIEFTNYDCDFKEEPVEFRFPAKVYNIEFSYDGGRVSIYLNNKEIFHTSLGGNDFCVVLKDD